MSSFTSSSSGPSGISGGTSAASGDNAPPSPAQYSGAAFQTTRPNTAPITKSMPAGRRLQKEMMTMVTDAPDGIALDKDTLEGKDLSFWNIDLLGPTGTLYEGETFTLHFKFGPKYPFDSPEVTFVGENIPVHPHVYSNGHICLSILTDDWSPALSVQAVCLSVISMLASCKEKKRPPDNSFYVKTCHKNPKKTRWWYHDDDV